jgi:hypothetical protein
MISHKYHPYEILSAKECAIKRARYKRGELKSIWSYRYWTIVVEELEKMKE